MYSTRPIVSGVARTLPPQHPVLRQHLRPDDRRSFSRSAVSIYRLPRSRRRKRLRPDARRSSSRSAASIYRLPRSRRRKHLRHLGSAVCRCGLPRLIRHKSPLPGPACRARDWTGPAAAEDNDFIPSALHPAQLQASDRGRERRIGEWRRVQYDGDDRVSY